MSERYTAEQHREYRKRVEAEAAREQQERRKAAQEAAKAAWIAGGGTASSFDQAWASQEREQAENFQRERRETARTHSRQFSRI